MVIYFFAAPGEKNQGGLNQFHSCIEMRTNNAGGFKKKKVRTRTKTSKSVVRAHHRTGREGKKKEPINSTEPVVLRPTIYTAGNAIPHFYGIKLRLDWVSASSVDKYLPGLFSSFHEIFLYHVKFYHFIYAKVFMNLRFLSQSL